jgi:hypothetical protein
MVASQNEVLVFRPMEDGIMDILQAENGGGSYFRKLISGSYFRKLTFKRVVKKEGRKKIVVRDQWQILDQAAFLELLDNKIRELDKSQDNKLVQGGIDLGQGDYLKVIATDTAGMPAFDPAQLMQLKKDLRGIIPVPLGVAQPVDLGSLI